MALIWRDRPGLSFELGPNKPSDDLASLLLILDNIIQQDTLGSTKIDERKEAGLTNTAFGLARSAYPRNKQTTQGPRADRAEKNAWF